MSFVTSENALPVLQRLSSLDARFCHVFNQVLTDSNFEKKYDFRHHNEFDGPLFYLFTMQPSRFLFVIEAFAKVYDQSNSANKRIEELTYHSTFENVIQHYTKSRDKPNPVLMETRCSSFCYLLTIKIEVVPLDAPQAVRFTLLREYQILFHIWDKYKADVTNNKCNMDQLVGFPMPFEFKNIRGTEFDLVDSHDWECYSPSGKLEPLNRVVIPSLGLGAAQPETAPVKSTLSYMSMEKVGPSVSYLMDLMLTQRKCFSMSSALKIYDQLIVRLMVMHKYGVIHNDVNPTAISFGTGETMNVLYINNFETAALAPTNGAPYPLFHDRFVSYIRAKDRSAHFVHDLESAFYVFLYLMLGRLPWDSRLVVDNAGADSTVQNARTGKSLTIEEKEKFWQSSNQILWMAKSMEMEFKDSVYRNFSTDIVEAIYSRVKESMSTCQSINTSSYVTSVGVPGSAPCNAYMSVRKIIVSYFRFESRSSMLKDTVWSAKIEILLKDDATDRRIAWDLSYWCWNHLDFKSNQKLSKVSQFITRD